MISFKSIYHHSIQKKITILCSFNEYLGEMEYRKKSQMGEILQ